MKPMTFNALVQAEWLPDGRSMRLLNDITYCDKYGIEWGAYRGDVVDGASIPKIAWSLVGSPFGGKYRRASVIHDVYCVSKTREHQRVHAVFNEMMGVDGVPKFRQWEMYSAVRLLGPKWG